MRRATLLSARRLAVTRGGASLRVTSAAGLPAARRAPAAPRSLPSRWATNKFALPSRSSARYATAATPPPTTEGAEEADAAVKGGDAHDGAEATPESLSADMKQAWRRKELGKAQSVYDEAKATGLITEELLTTLLLLNIGIRRDLPKRCLENVRALMDDAEEAGLELSRRKLVTIFNVLNGKNPNNEVVELAVFAKDAYVDLGAAVNTETYNTLLQIVVKRSLEKTLEVARSMRTDNVYPNQQTYATLVEGCTRHRDLAKAKIYLEQMVKMRYTVPVQLLVKVTQAASQKNDAELASMCLELAKDSAAVRGHTLDNHTSLGLANLAARVGHAPLLRNLRDHLATRPPSAAGLPSVLSGSEFLHARMECAAKSNDVDDVFECIRAMQAQGTEVQWQSMQSAARSIASDEESIDGAYYKAEQLLGTLGSEMPLDCINLVILGCGHIRDIGRAIETFDAIKEIFSLEPSVRSYSAVLESCIAARHGQGAHSFIQEMRAADITPDSMAYSTMARALVLDGGGSFAVKSDSVSSILKEMEEKQLRPERKALTELVVWSAKHRRFKTAWDFVKLMSSSGYVVPESLRLFVRNGGSDVPQSGSPEAKGGDKAPKRQGTAAGAE